MREPRDIKLFHVIISQHETWRKQLNDWQWNFDIRQMKKAPSEQWLTSNDYEKVEHYFIPVR